ncbi:hypothetical protein AMURIS_01582 [Acetatifactor muris]|uniref:Uncharacterized protein n=1 Tax=Acetatifactor muris TaxID=879566 RepID=A0A2K4ZEI4_9FIRM|nr:hypothetical protein AMURIS_01582 [Acetatifactor muris]
MHLNLEKARMHSSIYKNSKSGSHPFLCPDI